MRWLVLALGFTWFGGCATTAPVVEKARSVGTNSALERIVVDGSRKGFVTEETREPFHPWGMNYGNRGRLIEDLWETEWETLAGDFRELKAMGANVVRVSLQYGKFMDGPERPNEKSFALLRRMVALAEETRLYLDITGLGCYRPKETPVWYDAMETPERWRAQERFWELVAAACVKSPSVFCYDLINEPLSPGNRRPQWRSGSDFGGMDFLQFIAREPGGKKREDVAVDWIRRLSAAIRRHDQKTLITVGLLPWERKSKHFSGFIPEKVAPELDFISVHIYPETKQPADAITGLRKFAVGKPVVIEETFPLRCDARQLETFLRESRRLATGWLGHYDGQTIEELDRLDEAKQLTIPQSIYREWLRLFVRMGPEQTK